MLRIIIIDSNSVYIKHYFGFLTIRLFYKLFILNFKYKCLKARKIDTGQVIVFCFLFSIFFIAFGLINHFSYLFNIHILLILGTLVVDWMAGCQFPHHHQFFPIKLFYKHLYIYFIDMTNSEQIKLHHFNVRKEMLTDENVFFKIITF